MLIVESSKVSVVLEVSTLLLNFTKMLELWILQMVHVHVNHLNYLSFLYWRRSRGIVEFTQIFNIMFLKYWYGNDRKPDEFKTFRALGKREYLIIFFSYFSLKPYVVTPYMNCLTEMV